MKRLRLGLGLVVTSLATLAMVPIVSAQQSESNNYQVNEVYFGPGGNLNASSSNYQGQQTVEGAAGKTSSTNNNAQAGFNTTDQPVLELTVNGGTFDMGVLDSSTVHATSASFSIRNYQSSGYNAILGGTSLKAVSGGNHVITPMATAAASSPGTEQFGVNLRLNTNPPGIGADPQQQPDSTFSYGAAASGYNTPNQFKFVDGDIIASSNKSSGKTLYTLSAIANVTKSTDAGQYQANLYIIAVATF